MKKFIKENWFKIVISLVFAIISISVVYYLVIVPNKINEANKAKEIEALSQKIDSLSQEKPVQDTASEISNNQQAEKISPVNATTPKEDTQLKIEKCKAIADNQAKAYATAIAQMQQHLASQITAKYANAIIAGGSSITQKDIDRLEAQKNQEIASSQSIISSKMQGATNPTQSEEYLKCLNQ